MIEYCRNGHERTPTTTYVRPDGERECRLCRKISRPPTPRPSVAERFERNLIQGRCDDECWLWQGGLTKLGYGRMHVGHAMMPAHRIGYLLKHGSIPPGLVLDHLCRTPSCVNPAHLEAVTQRENLLRGLTVNARNTATTHCPKGHPYDASNTYRDSRGARHCRACGRSRIAAAPRRAHEET